VPSSCVAATLFVTRLPEHDQGSDECGQVVRKKMVLQELAIDMMRRGVRDIKLADAAAAVTDALARVSPGCAQIRVSLKVHNTSGTHRIGFEYE
jgi:hypothetical protein